MPKPSLYDPSYIDRIEDYLQTSGREQTHLPTRMGFAKFLGIHRDTLQEWAKEHKELEQALHEIDAEQKEQLMNDGLYGGKEINAAVAIFLMKVNHGMIEKNALDLTTDGKPLVAFDLHGKDLNKTTD